MESNQQPEERVGISSEALDAGLAAMAEDYGASWMNSGFFAWMEDCGADSAPIRQMLRRVFSVMSSANSVEHREKE